MCGILFAFLRRLKRPFTGSVSTVYVQEENKILIKSEAI